MFTLSEAAIIFRSAVGYIEAGLAFGPDTLTQRLVDKFGIPAWGSRWSLRSIALRAIKGIRQAGDMMSAPGFRPTRSQMPVTDEASAGGQSYLYRVLVTYDSQDGSAKFTFAIDVGSDSPLSWAEVSRLASDQVQRRLPRRSYRQEISALGEDPIVTFTLLSAGKSR